MPKSTERRKRNHYPHGIAIDPDQLKDDVAPPPENTGTSDSMDHGHTQMSDFFVTMCFFARLGFVQPPSCLKCAYRSAGCGETKKMDDQKNEKGSCSELVPWRKDANIGLHPDKLEGNIVFVTCDTAKSLIEGDAYPSIRWDTRNKRLLHEI
mmetsp:Transcript_14697/g.35415  ORF Transcript_14697/g.35415 Transcript_14697/m.35415 type:complete len:152 (-) Transcript_14697:1400-1855(-)